MELLCSLTHCDSSCQEVFDQASEDVELIMVYPVPGVFDAGHSNVPEGFGPPVRLRIGCPGFRASDQKCWAADLFVKAMLVVEIEADRREVSNIVVELPAIGAVFS